MLKFFAQLFSMVFHPLLIVTYMLVILLLLNPYIFGVYHIGGRILFIMIVFLYTFFVPGLSVVMMRFLGLITSLEVKDRQERIGPYIATGIFYLWTYVVLVHNPDIPREFSAMVLGATIALFMAFFVNLFSKVSVHAVGMGGLVGVIFICLFKFQYDMLTIMWGNTGGLQLSTYGLLALVIIFAGVVGSARLFLKAHDPMDLYGGYLIGFVAQFIAVHVLL